MKIGICDDEREIRNLMERNIRLIYPEADICLFEDGDALLSCPEQMDILFLDIQMEGLSGIETAREVRKRKDPVTLIFVTAIEEYVFQAFDVQAFHYLVKPIDQAKFFEVLRRAVEDRERKRLPETAEKAGIAIKKGSETRRVFLSEIIYLEVYNRKITLHTEKEEIEFYGKLTELEKSLGNDFARCHRSYIVNLRYVARYDAKSITLDNGVEVLLAKQKYGEFVRRYMRWIREEKNGGR